jgi:hypothetical protein
VSCREAPPTELLLAHLLGDNTPLADSVRVRGSDWYIANEKLRMVITMAM